MFDPNLYQGKYRIRSARAEWWEYYEGIYFITIVTKNRRHYFGKITKDPNNGMNEMHLSKMGNYVHEIIQKITEHERYAYIPVWTVMPNHIHFIVMIDVRGRDIHAEYVDEKGNIVTNHSRRTNSAVNGAKNDVPCDERDGCRDDDAAIEINNERDERDGCGDDDVAIEKNNATVECGGCRDDDAAIEKNNATVECGGRDARIARLYRESDNGETDVRAVNGANINDAIVRESDNGETDVRAVNGANINDGIDDAECRWVENLLHHSKTDVLNHSKTDRRTPEFMSKITPKTGSLPIVINQFKRAVTIFAKRNHIPFAWQSRYYDVILKDQIGFDRVRRYINNNVRKWKTDTFKE